MAAPEGTRSLAQRVDATERMLVGNGEPSKGLIVRMELAEDAIEREVRRLDRVVARMEKLLWLMAAGVFGLVLRAAWDILTSAGGGSS